MQWRASSIVSPRNGGTTVPPGFGAGPSIDRMPFSLSTTSAVS